MVVLLVIAYLMLNVETGTEEEVMISLMPIQEVREARMVYMGPTTSLSEWRRRRWRR